MVDGNKGHGNAPISVLQQKIYSYTKIEAQRSCDKEAFLDPQF